MKTKLLTIVAALALVLSLTGIVVAAPANAPEFFSNLTVNNNPMYTGDSPIFTIQGTMDFAGTGDSCLAIALPTNGTAWGSVTTVAATANGSPISLGVWATSGASCNNSGAIAAAPTSTQWWFATMPNSGATFQSVVVQVQATSAGTAGSYTIRAAMNDSAFAALGTWLYIDMTGNPLVQNDVPATRYVANNSSQCLGNSPCDTGTGGLAAALANPSATTIIILGAYNAAPGTVHTLVGGDTLRGQSGASININGACQSASAFLLVTGASTIQDLTFDGTCASGNPTVGIAVTAAGVTIQNVTIRDFANAGVLVSGAGTAAITGDTFTSNGIGISHTGGTANIGIGPTTGNTFTGNNIGISSIGTNASIKGNTISGGTTGIALTGAAAAVYGNTISGASGNQIDCALGGFAGAGFNYIGGNIGGGGTNCTDAINQLGSPIVSWTDSASLSEASVSGTGPIFDLGNVAPFGYAPPLGRNSKYYATTAGAGLVTITAGGGTRQFKMLMDGTGCLPMSSACWDSSTNGRVQSGAGYYFYGSQDPTAVTLRDLSATLHAETSGLWVGIALAFGLLMIVGWSLRRRAAQS